MRITQRSDKNTILFLYNESSVGECAGVHEERAMLSDTIRTILHNLANFDLRIEQFFIISILFYLLSILFISNISYFLIFT